ncbi:hypothetical protein [Fictibacillus sp. JL2B1089]|uniref:hypothetical protein n=1 Tax=Fictibacillus sp. JL2B1089 TaxID=3399565 RepID=UPI003A86EA1D
MFEMNDLLARILTWRFIFFTLLSFLFPFTYITLYKLLQKRGMPLWKKEARTTSKK